MIPLDVALDPDGSLDGLAAAARRGLAAAEAALHRVEVHERELADLPREALLPETLRLLPHIRRLATERVALYRSALQAIDQAQRER